MVKNLPKYLYVAAVYLVLYLPLFVTIVFSFNDSASTDASLGFTLKWYESLFSDTALIRSAFRSLFLAAAAATTSERSWRSLCTVTVLSDNGSCTDRCP